MTQFIDLGLIEPIQRALSAENYTTPTPIQAGAIPPLLLGRDLLGCAQTGTGKTAAFALPILQRLDAHRVQPRPRAARSLVLVPTRELATQVAESFSTYGKFLRPAVALVYGGVGQSPQVRAMSRGVDVLVATPGRLLDLMQQRHVDLSQVEIFVLDEADQMLDFGFMRDIEKILRVLPKKRQNVFFSATMPPPIAKLADGILHDPAKVIVTPVASTVDTVDQSVHHIARGDKADLLRRLLSAPEVERALVFVRTKRGADRVARQLHRDGLRADAIHGNKSQNARERTLGAFRDGRLRILVATDIAARGIDIDEISHVVNFELPNVPEIYVHRIGRTARAGASGAAISLCDESERPYLRDIERLIRRKLHVAHGAANHTPRAEMAATGTPPSDEPGSSDSHAHGGRARGHFGRGPARSHGGRSHGGRPHGARSSDNRSHAARPHERRGRDDARSSNRPSHAARPERPATERDHARRPGSEAQRGEHRPAHAPRHSTHAPSHSNDNKKHDERGHSRASSAPFGALS